MARDSKRGQSCLWQGQQKNELIGVKLTVKQCEQLKVLERDYFGGTMKIAGSDTPAAITRLRGVDSGRAIVAGKCKEG